MTRDGQDRPVKSRHVILNVFMVHAKMVFVIVKIRLKELLAILNLALMIVILMESVIMEHANVKKVSMELIVNIEE